METLTTIDQIVAAVSRCDETSGARIVVGLAGAPGSGKSTLAAHIIAALGVRAQLLPMDGFHLPQRRLVELSRRDSMGAPDTFDVDGFVQILSRIRRGGTVVAPGFDRSIEQPVADAITIGTDVRIVVVEGNYLLHDGDGWHASAPLFDLRLYLDTDQGLRVERLVARHIHFGKTAEAAAAWALGPD